MAGGDLPLCQTGKASSMTKQCKIDGCSNRSRRWGMCNLHSSRFFASGDPLLIRKGGRKPKMNGLYVADWVLAILPYDGDDCLPWPYARDKDGYGIATIDGKARRAHRYICLLSYGEPPTPKHETAHSCGNGHLGCVNPRHLRWATCLENQRERWVHYNERKAA